MEGKQEFSFITEYTSDSVEFCPYDGHQALFCCGTYQLIESERKKVGAIYLLRSAKDNPLKIEQQQTISTSAILDLKWSTKKVESKGLLGEVSSDGALRIYHLQEDKQSLLLYSSLLLEPEGLLLSLDWNNKVIYNKEPSIVVSTSNGKIQLCKLGSGGEIAPIRSWTAHEFEAWISAFDYFHPDVVYSGADDCKFKGWDNRDASQKPLFTKEFTAGVTTIQSNHHHEHHIAVGSYDETVTVWDTKNMKQPLYTTNTNGGVWRVKWHPHKSNLLCCASMRSGFHVIDYSSSNEPQIVASYRKDVGNNLAYGIDWSWSEDSMDLIGACSFYDKQCNLWKIS